MSVFVKRYGINQFNKQFNITNNKEQPDDTIYNNIATVQEVYRPQRYYRRKNAPPEDKEARVQITILEYGRRGQSTVASKSNEISQEVLEDRKAEEVCLNYQKLYYFLYILCFCVLFF